MVIAEQGAGGTLLAVSPAPSVRDSSEAGGSGVVLVTMGWSGDGSSDAEDYRPRSGTLSGEGADREEETRAVDIGGRGPAPGWVLLGKGCALNATARRSQSLHPLEARSGGPSPLYFLCQDCGSLLCRSHSEPSAELREGPLLAGHLAGDPGRQLSQAGPQACLPCPQHTPPADWGDGP
ncbi:unnamed protein product [Rangifer tarandus platyrhynchus]|uniref:Uncharacterized protein n=1 Tax=Rangifer tarandus platyrhynchus TaxID=3082113 RepID=A0AC59YHG5_RANTA